MAYTLIGKNFIPSDVQAKVTGQARYAEDFRAEGIETAAAAEHLAVLGCGFGQGFHISPPIGALELDKWLRRRMRAKRGTAQRRGCNRGA